MFINSETSVTANPGAWGCGVSASRSLALLTAADARWCGLAPWGRAAFQLYHPVEISPQQQPQQAGSPQHGQRIGTHLLPVPVEAGHQVPGTGSGQAGPGIAVSMVVSWLRSAASLAISALISVRRRRSRSAAGSHGH